MIRKVPGPLRRTVLVSAVAATVVVGIIAGNWLTGRRAWADAPAGWYTISGTGATATVTDNKTLLVWQQSPSTSTMKWQDAIDYCKKNTANLPSSGWRLPSLNDLLTLVDVSRNSPTIDLNAFPDTLSDYFWSSSADAGSLGNAWLVNFGNGSSYTGGTGLTNRVRCVR